MAAPLKLSTDKIQWARSLVEKRREAMGHAKVYPTIAKLAQELGCTARYLQKVIAGKVR